MGSKKIVIGTRGSQLALWQAHEVTYALRRVVRNVRVEVKIIKTRGDKFLDTALSKIGDKGLFTKELQDELVNKGIDIAVHSLKDLPTGLPDGCVLGGVLERGEVADALVHVKHKKFHQLNESDTVATSSPRRKAQLLHYHPGVSVVDIRGNINTRIRKLESGFCTALILASVGLQRLGLAHLISEILPPDKFLPAVGQGTIALEIRDHDPEVKEIVSQINHGPTLRVVQAERDFLRTLEGGCLVPIGCYSRVEKDMFSITGFVSDLEGKNFIKDEITGSLDNMGCCGIQLANRLVQRGAGKLLKCIRDGSK